MKEILDSYFAPVAGTEKLLARGCIGWAPSSFLIEEFYEIIFPAAYSAEFGKGWINLKKRSADECHQPHSPIFNHNPIKEIGLHATEAYAGQKFKLRPVVLISTGIEFHGLGDRAIRRVKSQFPDCFICAPIYSLFDDQGQPKYPVSFIEKIRAYDFPFCFHLAAESGLKESVVRFDRIQSVATGFLRPQKLRLSPQCQVAFDDWLQFYLTSEIRPSSEILIYKELLAEATAKPASDTKAST